MLEEFDEHFAELQLVARLDSITFMKRHRSASALVRKIFREQEVPLAVGSEHKDMASRLDEFPFFIKGLRAEIIFPDAQPERLKSFGTGFLDGVLHQVVRPALMKNAVEKSRAEGFQTL